MVFFLGGGISFETFLCVQNQPLCAVESQGDVVDGMVDFGREGLKKS